MSLRISEHFYSIQAEGATVGIPAYFLRLQGCNLQCGGVGGSLREEGKSTWWCDSEAIWKKGSEYSNEALVHEFIKQGLLDDILSGKINLVWTGGEPTLSIHREGIMNFIDYMNKTDDNNIFCEIETNGTIATEDFFYYRYMDQINCSPKLSNSGIPENKRIVPEAINQINHSRNSYFKFVISTEADIKEAQETYIKPFSIDPRKVIIMPGVDNRNDLPERTRFLFEMTKKYKYRGITRQQIIAWDRLTGV